MRRAVIAIVLVLGAGAAFRSYRYSYAPVHAYKAFAEDVLWRRYKEAADRCVGLSAEDLEKLGSQERIGAGTAMFQTLFPSLFRIESTDRTDGAVTIHAVQTVLFNPVGVESAIRPAMYAKLRQVVRLERSDGEWKVTSFENTFDSMDSLNKH